ncbi:MAG TPA: Lrp/AsnC family transcriptional regulator [Gemmatimonadaceae bacterium]|nr:Lrp/AsnC family transcriptional regulator [Gemmatimonadaceae bacterium]
MSSSASLDRTDRAILAALQQNARLTNKELAARVGLAESSCLERVRRLVGSGVLRGFHADVDPRALGVGLQALVAVRLARHTRAAVESFRRSMLELREAVEVFHVAGANDFLVHVAVRDSDELRDLILRAFTSRPEVAHVETSLIYEHARNTGFGRAEEGGG